MSKCKHEYESKMSSQSMSGIIYVCKKCRMVKPYKYNSVKENYFETLLKKYGR